MAIRDSITRRLFLRNGAAAGAATAVAVVPPLAEARAEMSAEFTAIPTEVVEKIKAWQEAHRSAVKAARAYSENARTRPVGQAAREENNRLFHEMIETNERQGPAREAMMFALWRV